MDLPHLAAAYWRDATQDAVERGLVRAPDVGTNYRALRRMTEDGLIVASERRGAPDVDGVSLAKRSFPAGGAVGRNMLINDGSATVAPDIGHARQYDMHADRRARVWVRGQDEPLETRLWALESTIDPESLTLSSTRRSARWLRQDCFVRRSSKLPRASRRSHRARRTCQRGQCCRFSRQARCGSSRGANGERLHRQASFSILPCWRPPVEGDAPRLRCRAGPRSEFRPRSSVG